MKAGNNAMDIRFIVDSPEWCITNVHSLGKHPELSCLGFILMAILKRTIRFSINSLQASPPSESNGFGGKPAMQGLGTYYELDAACYGKPDELTGYVVSIHDIDAAMRESVVPIIETAVRHTPTREPASLVPALLDAGNGACPVPFLGLRWKLTPTYSLSGLRLQEGRSVLNEIHATQDAPDTMIVMRQRFDFAASHRLHVDALSPEENQRVFGKCNNEAGHGHNYVVEPAVALKDPDTSFNVATLEHVVNETIIDRFDHTHLNMDTQEFNTAVGGVIPSVENITRVCFELLQPAIDIASNSQAALVAITVWETDRTCCTFPDNHLTQLI